MKSQKHMKDSERTFVRLINQSAFCQRIAGSGCGEFGVCDTISIENNEVYLNEIKSTASDKIVIDMRMKLQLEKLIQSANKNPPAIPRLVIHWKRRGWQTIVLNQMPKSPIIYNKQEINM